MISFLEFQTYRFRERFSDDVYTFRSAPCFAAASKRKSEVLPETCGEQLAALLRGAGGRRKKFLFYFFCFLMSFPNGFDLNISKKTPPPIVTQEIIKTRMPLDKFQREDFGGSVREILT